MGGICLAQRDYRGHAGKGLVIIAGQLRPIALAIVRRKAMAKCFKALPRD